MSTKKVTAAKSTRKAKAAPVIAPSSDDEEAPVEVTETHTVTKKTESDSAVTDTVSQVVTDWSKESSFVTAGEDPVPPKVTAPATERKSVLEFDRNEVAGIDPVQLTNDQLLMILIRRGEVQKNPVISGGCERLLRQINRERIQPLPHRGSRQNYDSHTSQGSQGSQGGQRQNNLPRPPLGDQTTPHFGNPNMPDDFQANRGSNNRNNNRQFQNRTAPPQRNRGGPPRGDRPAYTRGPRPDVSANSSMGNN